MSRTLLRSQDGLTSGVLIAEAEVDPNGLFLVCIHGGGCNSGYFEVKGYSTAEQARARGMPVLLVNRPGHGGNFWLEGERPIADMVPAIRAFIDQVRADHFSNSEGLAIIGHSIGGALALTLASERGGWPLRAVAVSGIGDAPSSEIRKFLESPADASLAPENTASLFLGPKGSYTWQAPIALRKASEPWRSSEVREVVGSWPARWPSLAAAIDVPVHLRLAEHDRLWDTGQAVIERMARCLVRCPDVDAALLPDGGHLYEIHKRGPELMVSQLDFLQRFAEGRESEKRRTPTGGPSFR